MSAYEERVIELEELGCTTSDAQSVADCEVLNGTLAPSSDYAIHAAIVKRINAERDGQLTRDSNYIVDDLMAEAFTRSAMRGSL